MTDSEIISRIESRMSAPSTEHHPDCLYDDTGICACAEIVAWYKGGCQ